MFYSVLADAALLAHAAFLAYLVLGGFLAWRWPRTIWPHLGVVLWGLGSVVIGYDCPLTAVEDWARRGAGQSALSDGGFIDHYLTGVVYPEELLVAAQVCAFVVVVVSWLGLAWRSRQRRRSVTRRR